MYHDLLLIDWKRVTQQHLQVWKKLFGLLSTIKSVTIQWKPLAHELPSNSQFIVWKQPIVLTGYRLKAEKFLRTLQKYFGLCLLSIQFLPEKIRKQKLLRLFQGNKQFFLKIVSIFRRLETLLFKHITVASVVSTLFKEGFVESRCFLKNSPRSIFALGFVPEISPVHFPSKQIDFAVLLSAWFWNIACST